MTNTNTSANTTMAATLPVANFGDFSNRASCKTKKIGLNLRTDSVQKDRYVIMMDTIMEAMKSYGTFDDEALKNQLKADLLKGYSENGTFSGQQLEDATNGDVFLLHRYVRYLRERSQKTGVVLSMPGNSIQLFDSMYCNVYPTFGYKYYTEEIEDVTKKDSPVKKLLTFENVKTFTGKSTFTSSMPKKDKEIGLEWLKVYASLMYNRMWIETDTTVPAGTEVLSLVTFEYLRRHDDTKKSRHVTFSDGGRDGGRNVITYTERIIKGSYTPSMTEHDDMFRPVVAKFLAGVDESECSEDDCRLCDKQNICKYKMAPQAIKIVEEQKKVSGKSFTKTQNQIMAIDKGITLVDAVAGAGKSTCMVYRLAELLDSGVDPEDIFVATYMVCAANELVDRIKLVMSQDYGWDEETLKDLDKMYVGTFNSWEQSIIDEEFARWGYTKAPRVIDDSEKNFLLDQITNIGKMCVVEGLDYAHNGIEGYRDTALDIIKCAIDCIKENNLRPDDAGIKFLKEEGLNYRKNYISSENAYIEMFKVYEIYENYLKQNNLLEYSDQEQFVIALLKQEPGYLNKFGTGNGYKHVIVDEFQDSNYVQDFIIHELRKCPDCESVMVVGDDYQSIMGFRKTSPEFMLNFCNSFPGEAVERIEMLDNFRCTPEIIGFANKVISLNKSGSKKQLIAHKPSGKPVVVKGFFDKNERLQFIADSIKEKLAAGVQPYDIAVLGYTGDDCDAICDVLTKNGIPSIKMAPQYLLKNSAVVGAIAFIQALSDPSANTKGLAEYANACLAGNLKYADAVVMQQKVYEAYNLAMYINNTPDPKVKKEVLMNALKALDFNDEIYESFLETLELMDFYKLMNHVYILKKYGAKSKVHPVQKYPGVCVTTCHSSKGLEWKVVYSCINKFDTEADRRSKKSNSLIEEKRRLFFVTATRAREELYVLGEYVAFGNAKTGYTYNSFLKEAYEANGMVFDETTIEAQKALKKQEEKRKKEEAKILAELQAKAKVA